MTSLPAFRQMAAAAAAATLLVSLTACGDDSTDNTADDTPSSATSPSSDAADGSVLAEEDLQGALLTTDDLPPGYVVDDSDDESDSETGTCLDDIANLKNTEGFEAGVKAKAAFELDGDAGQNSVSSTLNSYDDVEATDAALDLFLQTAQGCTTAQGTDSDGITYDLTLQTDDNVTLQGVDRQVSVIIQGSLTAEGQEVPVSFGFVVANIANNLAAVATSDLGDTEGVVAGTGQIAQTQIDDLAALS